MDIWIACDNNENINTVLKMKRLFRHSRLFFVLVLSLFNEQSGYSQLSCVFTLVYPNYDVSSSYFKLKQTSLSLTWSKTQTTGFLVTGLVLYVDSDLSKFKFS